MSRAFIRKENAGRTYKKKATRQARASTSSVRESGQGLNRCSGTSTTRISAESTGSHGMGWLASEAVSTSMSTPPRAGALSATRGRRCVSVFSDQARRTHFVMERRRRPACVCRRASRTAADQIEYEDAGPAHPPIWLEAIAQERRAAEDGRKSSRRPGFDGAVKAVDNDGFVPGLGRAFDRLVRWDANNCGGHAGRGFEGGQERRQAGGSGTRPWFSTRSSPAQKDAFEKNIRLR